jgi:hypothetical protein
MRAGKINVSFPLQPFHSKNAIYFWQMDRGGE